MTDISMSDAELLKFAIENGMIDTALVQEKVEMQKRKEILDKHPYKIYQGKDKKWYTYLPCDDTRKKIKSTSRDKLEDKVVLFWKDKDDNPTVNEVFYSWISEKLSRGEISKATYDRYLIDFEKYFVQLKELKIKEIDECFLEDFVKDSICQFNMTAKCFSNFRTLIYGIFKFAKRKKYVQFSITYTLQDMEISKRTFKKVVKRAEDQVYLPKEKDKMEEYLVDNPDIINLGWVQDRIVSPNRQNIGQILRRANLKSFDEMALLQRSEGRSIQDDFYID